MPSGNPSVDRCFQFNMGYEHGQDGLSGLLQSRKWGYDIISNSITSKRLHGKQTKINVSYNLYFYLQVYCSVSTFLQDSPGIRSLPKNSEPFFAGIKVNKKCLLQLT